MDLKKFTQLDSAYDVVVVGAGPAGIMTALNLNDTYKVLLVERKSLPRDKPCGGLLVEESQVFLKKFKLPNNTFATPKKVHLDYYDFDNSLHVTTQKTIVNVNRKHFDYNLVSLLKDKGVHVITECLVTQYKKNQRALRLMLKNAESVRNISTNCLVSAEGAISILRKSFIKLPPPPSKTIQEFIEAENFTESCVSFIFDSKLSSFFIWLIPKRKGTVIIGTAYFSGELTRAQFQHIKNEIQEKMGIKFGQVLKRETYPLLQPKNPNELTLGDKNLLFVGEAANLVSPSSGEGISFALRSGAIAAQSINTNISAPLKEYKKLITPLIQEIERKFTKRVILSDKEKRIEYFSESGYVNQF